MRKQGLFFVMFTVLVLFLGSCGKSGDTVATIKIIDGSGVPVAGALVHVVGYDSYGQNPGRIDRETTTDANGNAVFNFNDLYKRGSAGFAVLEVEASKGAMIGDGIVKVEDQVNNETTITIQ